MLWKYKSLALASDLISRPASFREYLQVIESDMSLDRSEKFLTVD